MIDALALVGDAGAARARLERFRDAGADLVIVFAPEEADVDGVERMVRSLA